MRNTMLTMLLKAILGLLLKHVSVKRVMELVCEAELEFTNPMSKRGHVYRKLKVEEADASQATLNLLVELGVQLVKGTR